MEITGLGAIILPITLIFLFAPRHWMLGWVVVLSTFWAGAVVIFYRGGAPFGLQPGYFAASVFLVREAIYFLVKGRITVNRSIGSLATILAIFAAFAVLSSWAVPNLLRGDVLVLPPRGGLGLEQLFPLQPVVTNTTQAMYAVFTVMFFAAAANFAATQSVIRTFTKFYLLTGAIVVGMGFLQFFSQRYGTWFPNELIFSNRGIAADFRVWADWTQGKVTSVFPEASMLAYWLSGFLAFVACQFVLVKADWVRLSLFIASFVVLALTTSSTAYLMIAVFAVLVVLRMFGKASTAGQPIHESAVTLTVVAGSLGLMAVIALLATGGLGEWIDILRETTIEKASSMSFEDRSDSDLQSLKLIVETWGLGAGWGSHRSSSLLLNFVANAGVPGTVLILIFAVRAYRLYRQAMHAAKRYPLVRGHLQSVALSVFAMIIAACISVPDFAIISFWVNVSVLIGMSARIVDQSSAREARLATAMAPAG